LKGLSTDDNAFPEPVVFNPSIWLHSVSVCLSVT